MVTLPIPATSLDKETVRSCADIVAVAGMWTRLQRRGREWYGLCPLHSETVPSFHVNPEKQKFYCHGCNRGGDVFRLVELHEGIPFPDAVIFVARFPSAWSRQRVKVLARRPKAGERGRRFLPATPLLRWTRKPSPRPFPLDVDWPSLDCAAERSAEAAKDIYTPSNNFLRGHRGSR